jgi:hypothetical protein
MAGQQPRKPIPRFEAAKVEVEVDEAQEFGSEMPIRRPESEGAELEIEGEAHLEPPPDQRGYRNLNERKSS